MPQPMPWISRYRQPEHIFSACSKRLKPIAKRSLRVSLREFGRVSRWIERVLHPRKTAPDLGKSARRELLACQEDRNRVFFKRVLDALSTRDPISTSLFSYAVCGAASHVCKLRASFVQRMTCGHLRRNHWRMLRVTSKPQAPWSASFPGRQKPDWNDDDRETLMKCVRHLLRVLRRSPCQPKS